MAVVITVRLICCEVVMLLLLMMMVIEVEVMMLLVKKNDNKVGALQRRLRPRGLHQHHTRTCQLGWHRRSAAAL